MTTEGFAEVFAFLQSDREDVRRLALRGIAGQSRDSAGLCSFLSSPVTGPPALELLLRGLTPTALPLLGDTLTTLINCAAEGGCAEALVAQRVVRKAMRLLDGIETAAASYNTNNSSNNSNSSQQHFISPTLRRGLEEMTLMLLSNLTASHICAVEDLLQNDDADLRGFYLNKLQMYYTRFAADENRGNTEEEDENNNNNNNNNGIAGEDEHHPQDATQQENETSTGETKGEENKGNDSKPAKSSNRDLQKWILRILLNLTRSSDGQEQITEDEDWAVTLTECLGSPNARHRLLAAQCYRNCSFQKERHVAILRSRCIQVCVERLSDGSETLEEIEMLLAEIIAGIMQSEEGMEFLEGINAKRHLQAAVTGGKLHNETSEFITRHVLPLLDDVVDAYVVPGSGDSID